MSPVTLSTRYKLEEILANFVHPTGIEPVCLREGSSRGVVSQCCQFNVASPRALLHNATAQRQYEIFPAQVNHPNLRALSKRCALGVVAGHRMDGNAYFPVTHRLGGRGGFVHLRRAASVPCVLGDH